MDKEGRDDPFTSVFDGNILRPEDRFFSPKFLDNENSLLVL